LRSALRDILPRADGPKARWSGQLVADRAVRVVSIVCGAITPKSPQQTVDATSVAG